MVSTECHCVVPLKHSLRKVQQCSKPGLSVLSCNYQFICRWSKLLLVLKTSPSLATAAADLIVPAQRLWASTGGAPWTALLTQTAFPCHCLEEVNRSGLCCVLQVGQGSFSPSIIRLPRLSVICGLTFSPR